jgi:hypothetical protein
MIPALLLLLSIAALVQFSFAFCRSLLLTYSKVELSDRVREVTGLSGETVEVGEFSRLMNLVFLAPDPGDDAMEIRSVTLYHALVVVARWFVSRVWEAGCNWCENELRRCAHFAAVTLDRRLAPAVQ